MGNERRTRQPPGYLAQLRVHLSRNAKKLKQNSKSLSLPPKSLPQTSENQLESADSAVVLVTETDNRDQKKLKVRKIVSLRQTVNRQKSDDLVTSPLVQDDRPEAPPQVEESESQEPQVYNLRDIFTGRRVEMPTIGLDIGTKTIVVAFRGSNGKTQYISEINGFWPFERATPFIENMLNDPNKIRSDGTKRPARWFKTPESGRLIVLGHDAEEFAFAKNDTLLRPMAEGGISPDEEAMTVLSTIIQGLLNMAEHDLGKFTDDLKICYCTTAPAINKETNIEYHQRVVGLILDGYETKVQKTVTNVKESHAIVLNMSPDGTGIGISWGAGTVTVSYVKYGMEIYSFCWVGAGDWIDTQVAMRHGYDPELFKTRKKIAKETPTTVARRKMSIDLTPGVKTDDRIGLDIVLHYDVLISQVIEGIVNGFKENEAQARVDEGINIYMAGGTSSPKGFVQRVTQKLDEKELPFVVGEVKRSSEPLFCVAEGCLKAAEMS